MQNQLLNQLKDAFEKHPNKANKNFSQTYLFNKILELAEHYDSESFALKKIVSKQQYYAVLYEILETIIFSDKK